MPADLTTYDFDMKELYSDQVIENLVYKRNPFAALVPKNENFYGDLKPIPVIYANPQGRSATFATAQANKGSTRGIKFNITRNKDYSLGDVDGETMEASSNDKGAFLSVATTEMDGILMSLSRSLAIDLYRTGSGARGQNLSGQGTPTITLVNIDEVTNFEVGQVIVVSASSDGTSIRSGSVTITGIDRDAGTLTAAANWTTGIAAMAANDFLYVQGDPTLKIRGLAAWIPQTAPSATAFFGVDRTADIVRLSGVRRNAATFTNLPIEEQLIDLAMAIGREGGAPNYCFMNFAKYGSLEKALGSKVQYVDVRASEYIGFKGIVVNGPNSDINVLPDQNCQPNLMYQLQLDTWALESLGKCPRVLKWDNNLWLRNGASDSVEMRAGYYAQLRSNAPGWNGVGVI